MIGLPLQLRRDTATNVNANAGLVGEVWVDTTNKRLVLQDGSTNGGVPHAKLSEVMTLGNGRTAITTSYTVTASDRYVGFTSIGVSCVVTLPLAASFPEGVALVIADETGACNTTHYVLIASAAGGTETINNSTTLHTLNTPFAYMVLYSNGVNGWRVAARSPCIQTFTVNGTYTPTPGMVDVDFWGLAGGGGGGGGARQAASTAASGGAGGAGGGVYATNFTAAEIGASKTVTIGAGGTGGAKAAADNTQGNVGTVGGVTSLGTLISIKPGGPGFGGGLAILSGGGGGGGIGVANGGAGSNTAGGVASVGGTAGGAGIAGTTLLTPTGGAGGGGGAAAGATGTGGGFNAYGPSGGGAGGGISAANAMFSGGPGGGANPRVGTGLIVMGGGATGVAGTTGTSATNNWPGAAAPGGGGGGSHATAAGDGGDGGVGGGGGGGGGSVQNGGVAGDGGAGGKGFVVLVEHFQE